MKKIKEENKGERINILKAEGKILAYLIKNSSRKKPIFSKEIENKMNLGRSQVSSLLTKLESNGYISRKPNKRKKSIRIINKGIDFYMKMVLPEKEANILRAVKLVVESEESI